MKLDTPISRVPLVGPAYVKRLDKLNIRTAGDLLYHFPYRYEDFSLVSPIAKTQPGEIVTLRGTMVSVITNYARGYRKIQKGVLVDDSGQIEVTWFNQPYLVNALKSKKVALAGKIETFANRKTMTSPEFEILNNSEISTIHTGRLVPIYHETAGLSSKWLRSRIAAVLSDLEAEEFLPDRLLQKHRLPAFLPALRAFHFPENPAKAAAARRRFAFEELFLIHLRTLSRKKAWRQKKLARKLKIDGDKLLGFQRNLPFELTRAQKRVLREILADLTKNKPMNRLLEGDVGSGKTVVAAAAVYAAYQNKIQSALMAPTEILATQHFNTLKQTLEPFGVKVALLTGGIKSSNLKPQTLGFDLLVGTHALIHQRAKFTRLGLVIIDEQHRFGVAQRSELTRRGSAPHLLTMTATPIPRTVALTLYGDLDLSVIDELPSGRQKIKTWVVPEHKRAAAYAWIRKQVKDTTHQAFIVCPLIEESAHDTLKSVRAAAAEFARLQNDIFPDLTLGLLHGRLKAPEKHEVLDGFKKGTLDILVATPVVEVGIDIPTATIMLIEAADRFGLAQLHQLRGRVGRGEQQAYCLLFAGQTNPKTQRRLKALERHHSGFELAELDLQYRGAGQIYGTAQHGFVDLKVASFADHQLIEETKTAASSLFTHHSPLDPYPLLKARLEQDKIGDISPN